MTSSRLSDTDAERFPVGSVAYLRVVVTSHDRDHGAPLCVETVAKGGRPDDASLTHWVRPEHLTTIAEMKAALRGR